MARVSSFSDETLKNVFKNNLKLDCQQKFKCSVREFRRNENILCLSFVPENEDLDVKYLMVKMLVTEDLSKKLNEYAKSLKDVFTVQDENKDVYLGFAKKDTLYPTKNNLGHLKTVLKSLAEFQAKHLAKSGSAPTKQSEYKVKIFSDVLLPLKCFKDLDKDHVSNAISRLQQSADKLFKDCISVKRVGNIFANNVFITSSNKCVFLDLGQKVFRSPVFDALIYIFALSDENFRQHHLKTLLSLYYQTFLECVEKIDKDIVANFDFNVFERHVKILLPLVKFETAAYLIQNEKTIQENQHLDKLLNNILYSLKYEKVIYEDCIEAIFKKIGSTEFDLLNYQLDFLDEQNGHLGQYFNLKVKIFFSGKCEEFNMFAKVLNSGDDKNNSLIQSGVSKKEQFFFRTLIPLYKEYGLESLVDFAPKCYFDRLDDIIIMENMTELGYKPFRPYAKIGYEVLKKAFLKAARFHACTLLLEERMSKDKGTVVRLGDIYKEHMEDWIYKSREGLPTTPTCGDESKPSLDQLIDSFEDIPKSISTEEFHKRVDAIYEVFIERITSPAEQFRNVVCHGDPYASNILIKYDQNNMPENCSLVDFQALRYTPIVADILMFAYFSASKDVRDKHLDILLEEYYEELKNILFQFGEDINRFYTPEEFAECVKYMKPVIVIAGVFYAQFIGVNQERQKKIFADDANFKYYYENRKESVKYLLSCSDDSAINLKGLIQELYDICVNDDSI